MIGSLIIGAIMVVAGVTWFFGVLMSDVRGELHFRAIWKPVALFLVGLITVGTSLGDILQAVIGWFT